MEFNNYNLSGTLPGELGPGTETLNKSSDANNRLPPSTAAPEYPYNNAMVTRSGHEMHWDDTPGRERVRMGHRAGTYFEISEDGRKVELVSANEYKYTKGGLTLTIDKNGDVKIGGMLRLVVGGDAHVEINGNATASIGGSLTAAVNKSAEIHAGESVTATAGKDITATAGENIYASAGQNMVSVVGGNLSAVVKGNSTELILGDRNFQVAGEYKIVASRITLDASGEISTNGDIIITNAANTIITHANTITSQANTISSIIPHV
jgi:hypothetical protein